MRNLTAFKGLRFGRLGSLLASTPLAFLFANQEPGIWLDPSDLTTLFQYSLGTTPVTAPGQPVGLVLDKSKGLVLGSELRGTGDITTIGSPGTLGTYNTSTGAGSAYRLDGSNVSGVRIVVPDGRFYLIDVEQLTGSLQIRGTGLAGNLLVTSVSGRQTYRILVGSGEDLFFTTGVNASTTTFSIHSVRELPGNHATQATAASRPTYGVVPSRGLVNLVPATNNLAAAGWNKGSCSVVGDKIIPNTSVVQHLVSTSHSAVLSASNQAYTFAADFKADGMTTATLHIQGQSNSYRRAWQINLAAGIISNAGGTAGSTNIGQSITPLEDGWYHVVVTGIPQSEAVTGAAVSVFVPTEPAIAGDGVSGIRMRNENFVVGSVEGVFQHVVSKYEVIDPVGFPSYPCHYLSFDGVDDFLVTPTITPGIDKAQVFAGVRKLSDAATNTFFEFGPNSGTTAGTLGIFSSPNGYRFRTGGTVLLDPSVQAGYVAPITNVLTGIGDISGDVARLRVNGAQVVENLADQGTGAFTPQIGYIGRRAGTSLPFNGRIYGLVTRFGTNLNESQIKYTESLLAQKAGVTL